uniref:Neuropeptide-like 4F n=1 Tax=Bombyx mori TaxID=7091 RepID=E9N020_BOMMO|nr:neuropeptide-like precursor 4F [Bombyx mori]
MFNKFVVFFALLAVSLAAPNPKAAPEPAPQFLPYTSLDYVYTPGLVPSVVSPYASAAGAVPITYSALPSATYYVR